MALARLACAARPAACAARAAAVPRAAAAFAGAPSRGLKVFVNDVNAVSAVQEAKADFRAKQGVKDINKRKRESRYYIKPTKQREGARSNKTFYTGVREVETVMARVLDEHKNVGFG